MTEPRMAVVRVENRHAFDVLGVYVDGSDRNMLREPVNPLTYAQFEVEPGCHDFDIVTVFGGGYVERCVEDAIILRVE